MSPATKVPVRILTTSGPKEMDAIVRGWWAVHRTSVEHGMDLSDVPPAERWSLTHVPSGRLVVTARRQRQLLTLAAYLHGRLGDDPEWDHEGRMTQGMATRLWRAIRDVGTLNEDKVFTPHGEP